MDASEILIICSCKKAVSCPSCPNRLANAFEILSRISPAAALVKVTINIRLMSTRSSSTILRIRSTKTAVFPEPAAAETKIFLFFS